MQKLLLTPGPINVSHTVKKEALEDYGSRDKDFIEKVKNIKIKLFDIFDINNENKLVLLQGSGTYGVNAVLQQVKGKVLLLSNGAYGVRMEKILKSEGKIFSILTFAEGTEIDYQIVDDFISTHDDIEYVAFVHLETSTGVLNNLEKIKVIAKKYNKKIIADCIASFGSEVFNFNDIDFIITSSNKCLQGIPGFVLVIAKTFDELENSTYCIDLKDQYNNFEKTNQFRFTPPTHSLVAFSKALDELKIETLNTRIARFKFAKQMIYDCMLNLGIKPFVNELKFRTGNVCHVFLKPDHQNYDFDKLYNMLAKNGFLIYPGKLINSESFRLGSIGNFRLIDIKIFLDYFKSIYQSIISCNELTIDNVDALEMFKHLESKCLTFYAGVPDSLMQDFNNCINDNSNESHVTANEGLAVSMACGYYTATRKIPVIYLQNSGIGNIINPLMSLAHPDVYKIPMLIIIGWRGEPTIQDEPQHNAQGECMLDIIKSLNYQYIHLDKKCWRDSIDNALNIINETQKPVFLIISKGFFKKYSLKSQKQNNYKLIRKDVLDTLSKSTGVNDIMCCTTGKSAREFDEACLRNNIDKSRTFLMVGSMGHLSSFCLGISLYKPDQKVWCIDGDGAILMHFGSIITNGYNKKDNFIHVLLNNGMHESVGNTPTICQNVDFETIAKAAGYQQCYTVSSEEEFKCVLNKLNSSVKTPLTFINILLSNASSKSDNLSRPQSSPIERINALIDFLNK